MTNVWYRVFGTNDANVQPADLLEHLQANGLEATGHFRGDDQGWFSAKLILAGAETPVELERYLATEKGIRDELNTWAAWLETQDHPHRQELMRQVIQSRQVFTLLRSPEVEEDRLCQEICRFLARETTGLYQADGQGFFLADGHLVLREDQHVKEHMARTDMSQ